MKRVRLFIIFLLFSIDTFCIEKEKISAILQAISYSADKSDIKLVGEYANSNIDINLPSLIKVVLGNKNLSSFMSCLSPEDYGRLQITMECENSEFLRNFFKSLSVGNSFFSINDLEQIDWQGDEQKGRGWGTFLIHKKNFCKILCEFEAKKEDGVWIINRLMIPFRNKKGFFIVFDENTILSPCDAILASKALIKMNKIDMAEITLLNIIERENDNIDALLLLAKIYSKTSNPKAGELYQKVLKLCSERIKKQEIEIDNLRLIKYEVYKNIKMEDKAKEYKYELLLNNPKLELELDMIDNKDKNKDELK